MTRLKSEQVAGIPAALDSYDRQLQKKTGASLKGIACHAAGISLPEFADVYGCLEIAVVPVNAGAGVIGGFGRAVEAVALHLGCRAFITAGGDVAGLAEAVERGARAVLMADDSRFVALHLPSCRLVDNSEAVGRGYVSALSLLCGGLAGREVLVIGAGRVGKSAITALCETGAVPAVFDPDPAAGRRLAGEQNVRVEPDLGLALERCPIIVDASPAGGIIGTEHIRPVTAVAAPGIPCGLTGEAYALINERLIHDPLEIGVAAMLAMLAGLVLDQGNRPTG